MHGLMVVGEWESEGSLLIWRHRLCSFRSGLIRGLRMAVSAFFVQTKDILAPREIDIVVGPRQYS